jgi:hypothetical protein
VTSSAQRQNLASLSKTEPAASVPTTFQEETSWVWAERESERGNLGPRDPRQHTQAPRCPRRAQPSSLSAGRLSGTGHRNSAEADEVDPPALKSPWGPNSCISGFLRCAGAGAAGSALRYSATGQVIAESAVVDLGEIRFLPHATRSDCQNSMSLTRRLSHPANQVPRSDARVRFASLAFSFWAGMPGPPNASSASGLRAFGTLAPGAADAGSRRQRQKADRRQGRNPARSRQGRDPARSGRKGSRNRRRRADWPKNCNA